MQFCSLYSYAMFVNRPPGDASTEPSEPVDRRLVLRFTLFFKAVTVYMSLSMVTAKPTTSDFMSFLLPVYVFLINNFQSIVLKFS